MFSELLPPPFFAEHSSPDYIVSKPSDFFLKPLKSGFVENIGNRLVMRETFLFSVGIFWLFL